MRSKPVNSAPVHRGHHLSNLRSAVLAWVDAQARRFVHCASISDQPRLKAGLKNKVEDSWVGSILTPCPLDRASQANRREHDMQATRSQGSLRRVLDPYCAAGGLSRPSGARCEALRTHGDEGDRHRLSTS